MSIIGEINEYGVGLDDLVLRKKSNPINEVHKFHGENIIAGNAVKVLEEHYEHKNGVCRVHCILKEALRKEFDPQVSFNLTLGSKDEEFGISPSTGLNQEGEIK